MAVLQALPCRPPLPSRQTRAQSVWASGRSPASHSGQRPRWLGEAPQRSRSFTRSSCTSTSHSQAVSGSEVKEDDGVRGAELENPDSDISRKREEAEKLRQQEKFMVIGTGEAVCIGCGYEYDPNKGDPEYPVPPGTLFQTLPQDWQCPICGAEKTTFQSKAKTIAGFAANQKYGLGTNSMTPGQKSILIYGSLLFFFALFLAGYFIE